MVKEVEKILAKYEEWYMPYDYSSLSVVEGYLRAGGGMEYPNLVIISRYRTSIPFISVFFNSGKMKRMALIDVISHEIGHQWFYGMVGNNEMDYPWLDEGFTTFTEIRYMKWRFPEDSLRSYLNFFGRLFHFKGGYGDFTKPWLYYLMDCAEEPLVGKKAYELKSYFFAIYMKGSLVLNALKDLMGEEKFNDLMKEYVRKFKFRHPVPQDFVRLAVERDSSLKYFFDFWLHEKEFPDFYCKRDKGRLKIGETHGRKLPVKISVDDSTFVALLPVEIEGKRGKVDPENVVVEKREWNNLIPRKVKFNPNVVFPDMEATNLWALPFGLYDRFNGWKPGIYFGAIYKPIYFHNEPVGSTSTIVGDMILLRGIALDSGIAGILLSGILSDTLNLTLSTTTEKDRMVAKNLARIAGVDQENYGMELLKSGTSLDGLSIDRILMRGFKQYKFGDMKIGLSQIFIFSFDEIKKRESQLKKRMSEMLKEGNFYLLAFLATNPIERQSFLIAVGNTEVIERVFDVKLKDGKAILKNIMSRKKDFLPLLGEELMRGMGSY